MMKRFVFLWLVMAMVAVPVWSMEGVYWDDLTEGGSNGVFEWMLAPDGTAVITGVLNQSATSLTIPAQLGGHDVKYIGYLERYGYGYGYGDEEYDVDYYSPLCDVGDYDDDYDWICTLKTIQVESTSIYFTVSNNALFSKDKTVLYYVPPASNVTSYSVPSGVQAIYHRAFSNFSTLKSVTIPSGVTEIGNSAFNDCEKLTSVSLPSTLKILHEYAFEDCKSLATITLPNSLEEIRSQAFEECRSLISITIPANVRLIGAEPFDDCRNLKEIKVASGNKYYTAQDGVLFTYDKSKLVQYPEAKSGSSYSIPTGVKVIGVGAFEEVSNLTQVTIPNTVTTIEAYAFSEAPLTSVTIPASVTYIGEGAFWECENLTRAKVTFKGEIPEGAENAFDFQVVDPYENFEFAEEGYDYYVTRYIGKGTAVSVPSYVQDDDNYNRWQVRGIASGAFAGCTKVKSIALPYSLNEIAPDAFEGCTSLEKFTTAGGGRRYIAEDGVLYEDGYYGRTLFRYPPAKAGKGFIIPEDVEEIAECAFDDCVNLKTVYTDNYYLWDMIEYFWPDLTVLPIAYALPVRYWIDEDGEAIVSGLNYDYEESSPILVIPATIQGCPVTAIDDWAFAEAENLESVAIPDSVTTIGEGAFWYCPNLREVIIPVSVTEIGAYAFGSCFALAKFDVAPGNASFQAKDGILYSADGTILVAYPAGKAGTSFSISNTVKTIGPGAFDGCEKLTAITVPSSVTEIGYDAFYCCTGLKKLAFPNGVEYLPLGVCCGCSSLATVTIPTSVTTIGEWAFGKCTALTAVMLPQNVCEIGYDAFYGCTGLKNLAFPNGVEYLPADVCYGCSSLVSVTIPDSVTTIDEWAFADCTALTSIMLPQNVCEIGYNAFTDSGLIKFEVASGNRFFKAVDGVLYSADGTTLVAYPPAKSEETFTVPSTVTVIGGCAFRSADNLTSVTIPDSVLEIGYHAFFDCASLSVLTIGDGVESLDEPGFFVVRIYEEDDDDEYWYYSETDDATGTIYTDNEYVREYLADNYPLVTVNYTGPAYDLTISLVKGWNAVVLPVTPDAASVSTLRSQKIYQLDPNRKCYVLADQFRQGNLYWFYTTANEQVNIHGVQKPSVSAMTLNDWTIYGVPVKEARNGRDFMEFSQGMFRMMTDAWLSVGKGYLLR